MFLCTCIKVVVTPCRNFLVKTLKNFCWISGNEEKLISLPKNLFVKSSSEHLQRFFDKPAVTMPAKVLKMFFAQSLKMIAMRNFQKEVFFPSFLSFKKQKEFHLGTQNAVVTTLPENSCQNSENRLLEFRKW